METAGLGVVRTVAWVVWAPLATHAVEETYLLSDDNSEEAVAELLEACNSWSCLPMVVLVDDASAVAVAVLWSLMRLYLLFVIGLRSNS